MERKLMFVVLATVAASAALPAMAATVTVNAPAGSVTNVRAFVTGEDALAVNTGATGGTVHLNPSSSHTGGTTLGSGTLVISQPVGTDAPVGELGAGPFVQQGGTLRYAGPADGVWTRAVTNTAGSAQAAVVWQVDNDLTVAGGVQQTAGVFVKTGAGTLTFTSPFDFSETAAVDTDSIRRKMLDLSPDRAPTQGYGNFTIVDGTVVIDTALGSTNVDVAVTNVLTGAGIVIVGVCTTLDGTETTGVLEHRSGVTRTASSVHLGSCNGTAGNSETPLAPTLRVTGGRFLVGPAGDKGFYMGVTHSGISGFPGQRNAPRLEVDGPDASLICDLLYASYYKGASSTIVVTNGGLLQASSGTGLQFSNQSGSTSTTNEVIISGSGSCLYAPTVKNSKTSAVFVRVLDGGTLQSHFFSNASSGQFHVVFDGGVWHHLYWNNDYVNFPSTLSSVKVGPGGLTVALEGGSAGKPILFNKGIEPLDDSGTDGGVHITKGARRPAVRFNAANTYCGPTEISQTVVYVGKDGRLPSGTALSVYANEGGLVITNGISQAVGSFAFGRDDVTDSPTLGFGPNARLDVTGTLHVGNRTSGPKFNLFETQGATDALVTPGTYTLITAREEDILELVQLSGLATFPNKPDAVDYTCTADVAAGRARLLVTVTPAGPAPAASGDPLVLNNTVLDETLVATPAQLAAARTIYTNPGYPVNKHGPVDLGELTGFARGGKLVSGSGTTYASDLSFANISSNITLKSGTFAYTGGDATVPGFTIDSSDNRSSVLSVTNENTTLTVEGLNVVAGSLTKTGLGTLKFKPPAGTTLVLPSATWDNGNYNGVSAYGDGPTSGFRAVNVDEGWLEIGAVDDPSDAPDIYGPADFSVGSQSRRNGIADQTAGSLRMNNGTLYLNGMLYVGYYCGNDASNPDLNLTPTIVQNGGLLSCTTFRMAHCNDANQQTASPRYFLHGGTNVVRNALQAGYSNVSKGYTYRATVDVDGGLLVVSNDFVCGSNAKSIGVDVAIHGTGRVEVGDIFYPAYAGTRETNTFLLAENGVLRAHSIDGYNAARGLVATFDGGTFENALPPSGYGYIRRLQCARIGAGGLNIDLSQHAELGTHNSNWLVIQQTFEHDPNCAGADGGITICGAGALMASTGFEESTFTGPIRVRDGARLAPAGLRAAPFAVQVAPGARLRDYSGTSVMSGLTLGEIGATDPVVLELLATVETTGFTATNSLQVLSPVAATMIQEAHDFQPRLVPGVYTALVYKATCPDVDLSLFRLTDADAARATLAAAQTTIDGGDFDGMKAVVLTVTAKNGAGLANGNVWTSVSSGGSWSTAANWENPEFVPNGIAQDVSFNPAAAAGVGVTLDAPVTVGSLTFNASSATSGYTLSGASLTIDGGNFFDPFVENASGTNTIAVPVALGKDTQFRTNAGNELRVTGGVGGAANLDVNTHVTAGAGQVNLKVDPGYAGKITTGSGRVVMDDLSFIQSASQLTLGRGTFLYTGPDVEIPGFRVSAGSGRQAIFESESDVTVADSISRTGTSAFAKYGSGTLRLHGTGTLALNTAITDAGVATDRYANGDGPTNVVHSLTVSSGTVVLGEVDDPANAPTVTGSSTMAIGAPTTTGDATLVLNGGVLSASSHFYLGNSFTTKRASPVQFTYRQNGGSLSIGNALVFGISGAGDANKLFELNAGTAYVKTNLRMARTANTSKLQDRIVVNGGHLAAVSEIQLAYEKNACRTLVEINGGTLTSSNTFCAARSTGNDTTLRLNPDGTFRSSAFSASANSCTTRFYANGGTFRPLCRTAAAQTMPAKAFTHFYASTNGLVVDTSETLNGAPFTMEQAILHDPDCEDADGGLVKRGAGTLTLSGANTYTGPTVVEGGILALSGTGTLGTGSSLSVAGGAVCDLGGAACAVADVTASGLVRNGGLTVTGGLLVGEDVLSVDGDLTLGNALTVDFAGRSDLDLRGGEPVAAVTGTATLPNSARAANAGDVTSVVFARDGNVVYAVATPTGTMVIFR